MKIEDEIMIRSKIKKGWRNALPHPNPLPKERAFTVSAASEIHALELADAQQKIEDWKTVITFPGGEGWCPSGRTEGEPKLTFPMELNFQRGDESDTNERG